MSKDLPLERMFRDARSRRIGEGTSEIQRMVIARNLLKDRRYLDPVGMTTGTPAVKAGRREEGVGTR